MAAANVLSEKSQDVDLRIRLAQLEGHTAVGEEIAEIRVAVARLDERSVAAARATEVALVAQKEHSDVINGKFELLRNQHTEFITMTKDFVTQRQHEDVIKRLGEDRDWRQNIAGREQTVRIFWIVGSVLFGMFLTCVGMIIAYVVHTAK